MLGCFYCCMEWYLLDIKSVVCLGGMSSRAMGGTDTRCMYGMLGGCFY